MPTVMMSVMSHTRIRAHARRVPMAAVPGRIRRAQAVLNGSGHLVRLQVLEGGVGRGHNGRCAGLGAAIGCV
jgi:hypothetical protein